VPVSMLLRRAITERGCLVLPATFDAGGVVCLSFASAALSASSMRPACTCLALGGAGPLLLLCVSRFAGFGCPVPLTLEPVAKVEAAKEGFGDGAYRWKPLKFLGGCPFRNGVYA
jgi:hypothetical protein